MCTTVDGESVVVMSRAPKWGGMAKVEATCDGARLQELQGAIQQVEAVCIAQVRTESWRGDISRGARAARQDAPSRVRDGRLHLCVVTAACADGRAT